MPEGSSVYAHFGFDIQKWDEKSQYFEIKQSEENKKLIARGHDVVYIVMDRPGKYVFKSYTSESLDEKKKRY